MGLSILQPRGERESKSDPAPGIGRRAKIFIRAICYQPVLHAVLGSEGIGLNTLGRLWLQMHPDSTIRPTAPPPLPSEGNWYQPIANYMVPNTGEKIRYERLGEDGQVETFKRAADIALLDPACGTMHFGQYAFGLFHQMYLDEIKHAGEPGWPAEPSIRDPKQIPAAIIEKNVFGIDIDARAIQIASLSLLLTAK